MTTNRPAVDKKWYVGQPVTIRQAGPHQSVIRFEKTPAGFPDELVVPNNHLEDQP